MPERWREIQQVDDSISANRFGRKRTENELKLLQEKIKNYDAEYDLLYSHKQFLGKEVYGDPGVRTKLVKTGLKCDNSRVREAAQKLKEQDTDVKWNSDVKEELINICVYIDIGVSKVSNWNISRILYKIGKIGYEEIDNLEG